MLSEILRNLHQRKLLKQKRKMPKKAGEIGCCGYLKKREKITEGTTPINFGNRITHFIECSTEEILQTRMNYLHEKLVRAGFCMES